MTYASLKAVLTVLTFTIYCISCQRPQSADTWVLLNKDRYVLVYTLTLRRTPDVSWWRKSIKSGSQYELLKHPAMDNFHESVTRGVVETESGWPFDVRLEISNINSSMFGEYKVEVNGNSTLTRCFTVNEMIDKTLDDLSEKQAASDEDRFDFSKSQVYIAVGLAVGILMVVALISVVIVIRIKTTKRRRSESRGDIPSDNNSGGISISSHHYTDVHSTTGYEGLGEKIDNHEYMTTRINTKANSGAYNDSVVHNNVAPKTKTGKKTTGAFANTTYGEANLIITSGINPTSLLKSVPKLTYKKKQNKGRRFSDSTSDREDSCTYENVIKKTPVGHNYENCNHLKRTKSAQ
ncbi:uncharacterized protein LOC132557631 isoform X2 [Ylistrum balloti]|uniref:uncharacterized protein LOC132557631 isoform X2 n=1 Tax=Ylistrum balloti TaxID=509963 RepID=UPI002905F5C0|nr:uncharacterized protein LOC132557631 isoform X2 [Ylistrum balloti]